jgi:uncharacterized protein YceK
VSFCNKEFLAPHPIHKIEDHLFLAVCDCLFTIFAASIHIGGCSSICNLRTCHAVVTGTYLSWTSAAVSYQKFALMWYVVKHQIENNSTLLSAPEFCFCFFVLVEHSQNQVLFHCKGWCSLCLCLTSSLFSFVMDVACLPCPVIWVWGTLPASCIRFLTNTSLNGHCDSFEPQDVKMLNGWELWCPECEQIASLSIIRSVS